MELPLLDTVPVLPDAVPSGVVKTMATPRQIAANVDRSHM
jgi:hypothetical protein